MIAGRLLNLSTGNTMAQRLARAYEILQQRDFAAMQPGRYDEDETMFFLVQEYQTKPQEQARFEAHRRYADIQVILTGEEAMDVMALDGAPPLGDFDATADIGFYQDKPHFYRLLMRAGEAAVFFPQDCHKPSFHPQGSEGGWVKKVVVKVLWTQE